MRTVTYNASQSDLMSVQNRAKVYMQKSIKCYNQNSEHYSESKNSVLAKMAHSCALLATFSIFEEDQLANINKNEDSLCSLSDLKGDCFDAELNSDIDPKELKRQERNFEQRVRRNGVHYHELFVMDESIDLIGGFVGDDFYGSGIDDEFYHTAFELINAKHNEYSTKLLSAALESAKSEICD